MSKMLYQMVCKTLVIFNSAIKHSTTMKPISGMISYGACIFIAATLIAMVFV